MSACHGPPVHPKLLLYWFLFLYNLVPVSGVTLTSNVSGFVWLGTDSVSLTCTTNHTDVSYSWSLQGKPLPQEPQYLLTQSNSILIISPVSLKSSGPFTCTASNQIFKETSIGLNLTLAYYPTGNTACTAEFVGQNIQLGCSWPEGWPAANVTMEFNQETLTGQSFVFTNVSSVSTIQGSNLTCRGDQLGKTSSCRVSFELPRSTEHIDSSVAVVMEGDNAVMTLNLALSSLPAVFTWYRWNPDPVLVSITSMAIVYSTNFSSSLQISYVVVEDAGQYECRARNIIGTQSFFFLLNVTEEGSDLTSQTTNKSAIILSEIVIFMTIFAIVVVCVVKRSKGNPEESDDNIDDLCEKAREAEQQRRKDKALAVH